jgi:hypothetical protein
MPKGIVEGKSKRYNVAKPIDKETMIRYTVDRLTTGIKVGDVAKEIEEKFKVHQTYALQVVNDSKDSIKNQMKIRVPFILSVHVDRYEYLFKKFETIGRTDLMNKCLLQKEELLNLKNALSNRLSDDFVRQEVENKFNYNKLSNEKKIRIRQLIEKGLDSV